MQVWGVFRMQIKGMGAIEKELRIGRRPLYFARQEQRITLVRRDNADRRQLFMPDRIQDRFDR